MAISEAKALVLLDELIKKPEAKADEIPGIWRDLINIYNTNFSLPQEVVKKKRRRRVGNTAPIGWPKGVKRAEYQAWKDDQTSKGISANLNPQEYKRQRDTVTPIQEPTPAPKSPRSGKKKPG